MKLKLKIINMTKVISCGMHDNGLPDYCYYDGVSKQGTIISPDGNEEEDLKFTVRRSSYTSGRRVNFKYKDEAYYFDNEQMADYIRGYSREAFSLLFQAQFTEPRPSRIPMRLRHAEIYAGRTQELYENSEKRRTERRDCTVRAMAECLQIPYDEAHAMLAPYRRPKHGIPMISILQKHFTHLFRKVELDRKMTTATFARERRHARYIVMIRAHALCVADGKVYDGYFSPGAKVYAAFIRIRGLLTG